MTEDEAKTKVCCGAAGVIGAMFAVSHGEPGSPKRVALCLASSCMAWRWAKPEIPPLIEESETGTTPPRVKIAPPDGDGWIGKAAGRDKPDRPGEPPYRWVAWEREIPGIPGDGYCGLAGVHS